jgi:hypothetical protein
MTFEELDASRDQMVAEFRAEEQDGNPYRSKRLSTDGLAAFPDLMLAALQRGDIGTLTQSLAPPAFWLSSFVRIQRRKPVRVRIDPDAEAVQLALTEFNTWYVRGLAARLMREGEQLCEVYRAGLPKKVPAACSQHEGRRYPVEQIYGGHRRRYWPEPGDATALSIPREPNCHHSIRRIRPEDGELEAGGAGGP